MHCACYAIVSDTPHDCENTTYRVLLDAPFDELAIAIDWRLTTQEDQTGYLCRMRFEPVSFQSVCFN